MKEEKTLLNKGLSGLSRKLDRLSAATHLVTSFLERDEPLRGELRKGSLQALNVLYSSTEDSRLLQKKLSSCLARLSSLFRAAKDSEILSPMNASLLERGYEEVLSFVAEPRFLTLLHTLEEDESAPRPSEIGDERHEKKTPLWGFVNDPSIKDTLLSKRHDSGMGVLRSRTEKKADTSRASQKRQSATDSQRKDLIIEAVRKVGTVSIKDITSVIKDVSEKTIQRDLLSLVSGGVLEKQGERRWSRYSLASGPRTKESPEKPQS